MIKIILALFLLSATIGAAASDAAAQATLLLVSVDIDKTNSTDKPILLVVASQCTKVERNRTAIRACLDDRAAQLLSINDHARLNLLLAQSLAR